MLRCSAPLLATVVLASCSEDLCDNRILHAVASPDGRYFAVLFERDCGATTAVSFQVSILPAGEAPGGTGNVFIAEPGNGQTGRPGAPAVEVAWLSPRRLRIRYRPDDEIFKRVEEREGVQIDYGPSEP